MSKAMPDVVGNHLESLKDVYDLSLNAASEFLSADEVIRARAYFENDFDKPDYFVHFKTVISGQPCTFSLNKDQLKIALIYINNAERSGEWDTDRIKSAQQTIYASLIVVNQMADAGIQDPHGKNVDVRSFYPYLREFDVHTPHDAGLSEEIFPSGLVDDSYGQEAPLLDAA